MERIGEDNPAGRLHQSERRFRMAVEQSPISTQIFAPNGDTLAVNPAWERLWASDWSEVAGYNILKDPQLENAGILPLIRRAFAGEAVSLPTTFYDPARIGKTGRSRWVEGYIYPLRSDERQDFEVALVHYDVTEHRLAEQALRDNQSQLSAELAAMRRLQETSTRMIPEGRVEVLYEDILDTAIAIMRSDFASIQRLETDSEEPGILRLLSHRGFSPDAAVFWEQVHPSSCSSTCGKALSAAERVIVSDVDACAWMAGTEELSWLRQMGIRAVQTTPLFSRSGQLLGMISTHWREPFEPDERTLQLFDVLARQTADLIERTRAEQALRIGEARYRTLFESIDEGFSIIEILFDENGAPADLRFLEVNPAFERQSGLRNVTGRRMREVLPEFEEHWYTTYGEVARTGCPVRFVNRSKPLNRWFDIFAFRIGEPSQHRVAVLFTDITSRQQAYDELVAARKEAEAERLKLQEIFSRAPSAMATLRGEDLVVETVNPVWLKLLGKSDVIGKPLSEVTPELQEQGFLDLLARIYRVGESYSASELPIKLNRGGAGRLDEVVLNIAVQPLFTAEEEVSGLLIHAVDVTEQAHARRQVESLAGELEQLNEHLEQRVEERTAALERMNAQLKDEIDERLRAERALAVSNEALVRSNRELQEFAYVASHDLQEPLRKISTFIDLLRLDCGAQLDKVGHEYMTRLQDSSRRLSELIHGLLAYSRVTTRNLPFQQVDLGEAVRNVLSDLEIAILETDAKIEVGELPSVVADPIQVRQLLQNLISNAIKFHQPGKTPTICIYSTDEPPADGERVGGGSAPGLVRISIEDDGIGFDEQHVDRIFAPFQRLHGRSEYPGTGIGLAICRRIMERHGGSITCRGRPHQGAVFTACFPVRPIP